MADEAPARQAFTFTREKYLAYKIVSALLDKDLNHEWSPAVKVWECIAGVIRADRIQHGEPVDQTNL